VGKATGGVGMAKRAKIPPATEAEVLRRSGRRCCICVALLRDVTVKQGQIAHLDQDATNNNLPNLAFLCLNHHDQYDGRTSQSKGFTELEVKSYRDQLYADLPSLLSDDSRADEVSLSGNLPTGDRESAPNDQERQIYTELWNRLFDFRLAAHNLVDWVQDRIHEDPHGKFIATFNAYQAVVRRNEPFIDPLIYEPARAILSLGREIDEATQDLGDLQEQRDKCRGWEADEQIAEKMFKVEKEQQQAVKQIDRLFDEVKNAIRNRMMPTPPQGSSS